MNLKEAIKNIFERYDDGKTLFVSTDGLISREMYHQRKDIVFPMVGSMGLAPAIGLGVALNTEKRVVIVNGDGSYLMSAGTHHLIDYYRLACRKSIIHIILDNDCYGTTGGQVCLCQYFPLTSLVMNIEDDYTDKAPRITDLKKIKEDFIKCVKK